MKNRITTIVMFVSIILLVFSTIYGMEKINILSISKLQEKNNEVIRKINEASTLTSIEYPEQVEIFEETYDNYLIKKQKYEELADVTDEYEKKAYETKQYDIGYLWRILGKYATKRNLTLGIDVKKNNGQNDLYDFNFSVSGQYVNISQFILDLENDSELFFRIYDFNMRGSGENISSTFTVKDINIDPSTLVNVASKAADTVEEKTTDSNN